MTEASKTLGRIAQTGGIHFGESFMNLEVPAALELLSAQSEFHRYAGVLILKELARNSDVYFHAHIGTVLDAIFGPLRDSRLIVREGAAELLAACLEIVISRDRNTSSPYLVKIYNEAQVGLKGNSPEVIHGSLLAYRELLLHAGMVRLSIRLLISRSYVRLLVHAQKLYRCR
jgi:FKBP12-rapamycin complex-associated protein